MELYLEQLLGETRKMAKKKTGAQLDREIAAVTGQSVRPTPPGQAEYEQRELNSARLHLNEVEKAPLADRQEAAALFLEAMKLHPDLVAERIGWLLNGTYGYGQMLMAKRVLASPRMNRSAALTHMVAAFEWQAPNAMVIAGWKKLTAAEQLRLEREVQKVIRAAERG